MSDTHSGTDSPDPPEVPPAQPQPDGSRRRGRSHLAVLSAVAGVTVVAIGAGLVVAIGHNGSTGSGTPPVLRLLDAHTLAAEADAAGGSASALASHTVVSGSLPDTPDHARIGTFGTSTAPKDTVTSLARAVGLTGTPVHQSGHWQVSADNRILVVSDAAGWSWSFGPIVRMEPPIRIAPEPPVRSAQPSSVPPVPPPVDTGPVPTPVRTPPTMSCLVIVNGKRACPPPTPLPRFGGTLAPGDSIPEQPDGTAAGNAASTTRDGDSGVSASGTTSSTGAGTATSHPATPPAADPPPTPTADQVRSAARPVLAELGLSKAPATVHTSPGLGMLTVNPEVNGLPTRGFATVLRVDGSGTLVSGSGWLATPRQGTQYPLATARAVLAAASRCDACGDPTTVTGATPGLLLRRNDRNVPLLVPAWFYRVRGSDEPITLVAVDPDFLGTPRSGPGAHSGGGLSTAAVPDPARPRFGVASPTPPAGSTVTRPSG